MKQQRKPKKNNAKRNQTITSMHYRDSIVLVSGVLGKLRLPLPWEIVTADICQCDNEGAWRFYSGGGWAIMNANCGKYGGLKVGRKLGGAICNRSPQAPPLWGMTLQWLGNRQYLFPPFSVTL